MVQGEACAVIDHIQQQLISIPVQGEHDPVRLSMLHRIRQQRGRDPLQGVRARLRELADLTDP